jgi:hypothetical protein
MERKMKVSETEMCPLTRGIFMVMREPTQMVMRARKRKRMSMRETGTVDAEKRKAAEPRAIIAHIYGFAYSCLLKVLIFSERGADFT